MKMAQSRLEKIGSIYTRIKSLLETNGIPANNKPLWFELYEAFPPKYEPCYDKPILTNILKSIFYTEDKIRMKFQKDFKNYIYFYLNSNHVSSTENFMHVYKKLEQKNNSEDDRYKAAVKEFSNINESYNFYKKQDITKNEFKKHIDEIFQTKIKKLLKEIRRNDMLLKKNEYEIEKFELEEMNDTSKDSFDLKHFLTDNNNASN